MLTAVIRNDDHILYRNRSHDLSVCGANIIGNSSLLTVDSNSSLLTGNSKKRRVTMICVKLVY